MENAFETQVVKTYKSPPLPSGSLPLLTGGDSNFLVYTVTQLGVRYSVLYTVNV